MATEKYIKYFNCDWSQSECTNVLLRLNFQLPTSLGVINGFQNREQKLCSWNFNFPVLIQEQVAHGRILHYHP